MKNLRIGLMAGAGLLLAAPTFAQTMPPPPPAEPSPAPAPKPGDTPPTEGSETPSPPSDDLVPEKPLTGDSKTPEPEAAQPKV